MLRKERNVYVLDLFVRVPPNVTRTRPWRLMQPIKSQTEEREESESRFTATAQLFDGRRSERGRMVQLN